jgi:pimeloyl-ACP methyl ester carboxylesterase
MSIIDQKRKVTLDALPQKIHIRSNDETLPVLLFLHGGPGVVNRHAVMINHSDLLDTFTLAAWDQRGSGGSYKGARRETLTVRRLTDDAAELVDWLYSRFEMPYFIFDGRLDYNTPASLVDEYFNAIQAPRKELIWFEKSGHNPMGDEGELFKATLRAKLSEVAEDERAKGVIG